MGKLARAVAVVGAAFLGAWPLLAAAQGAPRVSFTAPTEGSTVTGPRVEVKLRVDGLTLVDAGTAVKAGEGHAHLFIDRDPVAAGAAIPTDQSNIIHLGKAPYDTRTVDLTPGRHTLHAVLADSDHKALTPLASSRVSFTVSAAAQPSPPARAAATGDGSLASDGSLAGVFVVLGLAAVAIVARVATRRV